MSQGHRLRKRDFPRRADLFLVLLAAATLCFAYATLRGLRCYVSYQTGSGVTASRGRMAPSLVGISGPLQGITFPLDGDLSIGREPGNDICIPVPAVSRRHGVVRVREGSYEIVDLGSRNGTFVNDVPVTQRPLVDGDRISISNSVFVFANPDGADEGKGSSIELVDAQGQTLTVALHAQQALRGGSSQATGQPLARVVETLQALLQINRAVAAIRDPRALQEELLRRLFDVSPADRAALLLYDDREAPPSSIVGLERSGGTLRSIALSRSIAAHVLSHDVAVLVEDVEQ